MMKNVICFTLKALFVIKIFEFRKRLVKKAKVNFKIHDVTNWETNIYNTHIAQYFRT